tara:strand:- start:161 stop:805 length:645 start_codon:yes stop_codon:yes gene_type:complete
MKILNMYTDGACPNNGTPNAYGGFGMAANIETPGGSRWVYTFYPWCLLLEDRYGKPTNQKCELAAVMFTVRGFAEEVLANPKHKYWDGEGQIVANIRIHSDSKYVVDGINAWLHNWRKNDWKNSKKKPIANMQMWKDLDNMLDYEHLRGVFSFYHVAGHSGDDGNDAADEAANFGAEMALSGKTVLTEADWAEFVEFVEGELIVVTKGAKYDFK